MDMFCCIFEDRQGFSVQGLIFSGKSAPCILSHALAINIIVVFLTQRDGVRGPRCLPPAFHFSFVIGLVASGVALCQSDMFSTGFLLRYLVKNLVPQTSAHDCFKSLMCRCLLQN